MTGAQRQSERRGDLERAGKFGPVALSDAAKTPIEMTSVDRLPDLLHELVRIAERHIVGGAT